MITTPTDSAVRRPRRYGFRVDALALAIMLILALRIALRLLDMWHTERMERRATAWCRTFGRLAVR